MSLDMYLYRTKRVSGLPLDGYLAIERAINRGGPPAIRAPEILGAFPRATDLETAVRINDAGYATIFDRVAYWCKANAIPRWFVNRVHEGEDDSFLFAETSSAVLQDLLATVDMVLNQPQEAARQLPVQPGLFFGPTTYSRWYWHNLTLTRDQLREILDSTDFDQQTILYHCWW